MILFDGRREPAFRTYFGGRLREADGVCVALRRLRLARLDLTLTELGAVRSCRLLLGRLDADDLHAGAHSRDPARLAALLDLAASERLQVRAAGVGGWEPDFSILRSGRAGDVLLLGCHRFAAVDPGEGPSFACAVDDAEAVRIAQRRFDEMWARSHDVLEAVTDALCRVPAEAADASWRVRV